ncbi:MAG: serine/threonine-protein kinase [Candidatus Polarisedimenticolia bacterium]
MSICPSCSAPLVETGRFCSACGSSIDISAKVTVVRTPAGARAGVESPSPPVNRSRHTAMGRLHLSDSLYQARFLPGMVVADRYRIVGLLGKGGMGEVYRADDLKLGQAVALKFLPDLLRTSPGRLELFYDEVRLARQVSHPHVCRVYDVGEIEGAPFLTMEYIDGEDLSSLLRRIGRLPQERAVQVARQICAGLAAIHDKGILHRDLKPANVMLDGRGTARITDFGLAAVAGGVAEEMLRSGTPAYMAPEQLAGQEPNVRSDIYALGLVLYEMFTGRGAFEAESIEELTRKRRESRPDPSSQVHNLDPIVERVLLRCLENDPRDRPGSALSVAAALPGGDPLAAALAAGETPSPEMVAAAGEPGALTMTAALSWLAVVVVAMGLLGWLAPATTMLGLAPVRKSPAALEERARQVVETIGYAQPPADDEGRFAYDRDYMRWVETNDQSGARWQALSSNRPPAIFYYYRQSPRALETRAPHRIVDLGDPPNNVAGMVSVLLDTDGRLVELLAVPPQVEDLGAPPAPEPDAASLFSLAGLDMKTFTPTTSSWTPAVYADSRAAWQGPHPGRPDVPVRVEAAFYRGKPVYFDVVGPWTRPVRAQIFEIPRGVKAALAINIVLLLAVMLGAMLLARRNLRLGRGDRRGAWRVGVAVFLVTLAGWILRAHHTSSLTSEWSLFIWGTAFGLFLGGVTWMLYLALEPFVRKKWPDSIISWTRLLAGWWRDPRIGRDALIGTAFGLVMAVTDRVRAPLSISLGAPPSQPAEQSLDLLRGARFILSDGMQYVPNALTFAMFFLFWLFLGRWLSDLMFRRRPVLRTLTWVLFFMAILGPMQFLIMGPGPLGIHLPTALIISALTLTLLVRFGLLACIVCMYVFSWSPTISFDLSTWYAPVTLLALLIPLALAAFGLVTSLGGRRLLGEPALAD